MVSSFTQTEREKRGDGERRTEREKTACDVEKMVGAEGWMDLEKKIKGAATYTTEQCQASCIKTHTQTHTAAQL